MLKNLLSFHVQNDLFNFRACSYSRVFYYVINKDLAIFDSAWTNTFYNNVLLPLSNQTVN